ncbi:Fe-S oxidoreductase [Betaproteobacteria bacterium UKL13-2]|nr:Fe-S oxidoreductase [Betaproteobacteria bacterium UKL13-2]HCG52639.1 Fe-S oxidoreductase [Betaproteobacteria bacterium]
MKVGLFVTCLVDLVRPNIGFAALKLLEDADCTVVVPESQTCCGQPGYNSGAREIAKTLARKVLNEFQDCDYIVAPSGSCSGQMKVHVVEDLFKGTPEEAEFRALAAKWYELSDFLVKVLKVEISHMTDDKVTYHDSCSGLREINIKSQPRFLLLAAGAEIREMADCEKCCGFGGTFSIKLGEISTRMAENKCVNIHQSGADVLVGGDLGCLLNIEGRLRRNGDMKTKVYHFAEVVSGMTER